MIGADGVITLSQQNLFSVICLAWIKVWVFTERTCGQHAKRMVDLALSVFLEAIDDLLRLTTATSIIFSFCSDCNRSCVSNEVSQE